MCANRSILGPALGGALAEPCTSYPALFPRDTVFDRFPYLLPNLVCAVIIVFSVIVGILFLEETHEEKKDQRDTGLEAGRWILKKLRPFECLPPQDSKYLDANLEESRSLLEEDEPPGYRTTEGSPRLPCSRASSPAPKESFDSSYTRKSNKPPPLQKAFTRQVVLNIIGYGILA
jgi:hypothetical protein